MAERRSGMDSTSLGEEDLKDLMAELHGVAARWRYIGLMLGIPDGDLEAIREFRGSRPIDCLVEMLIAWLRKAYNVERFGEPTWLNLVEAVAHKAGGANTSLAEDIARRHKRTLSKELPVKQRAREAIPNLCPPLPGKVIQQHKSFDSNQPSVSYHQKPALPHHRESSPIRLFHQEASSGCHESLQGPLVNTIHSQLTDTRTVIVLGVAGSGKRTLVNHIAGQDLFRSESQGKKGNFHYGSFCRGKILYRILSIDLGTDNISTVIRDKIQTVNLIMFVIAQGSHTDECHLLMMDTVKGFSHHVGSICALVVTNCDGMKASMREDMLAKIRDDDRLVRLAAITGKGMYAVGFPMLPPYLRLELKTAIQEQITEDEIVLRQLVANCDHALSVVDILSLKLPA